MNKNKIPLKTGDEYDALTGLKKLLRWRPGERKKQKNFFNRRMRRYSKKIIEDYKKGL